MHPEFRETTIRHWERELDLAYREARAQDRGVRIADEQAPMLTRGDGLSWWGCALASWRLAGW